MLELSEQFIRRIEGTFGATGRSWLQSLPSLLNSIADMWSLSLQQPFSEMAYNYVAPAICSNGTKVVLKISVPNPELLTEIEALRIFNGQGMVRLLDASPELGAMLLEKLEPGQSLIHLNDDVHNTHIAAEIMKQLHGHSVSTGKFPSVADWMRGFSRLRNFYNGSTGPFQIQLVETAERIYAELLASERSTMLLHGDLHHTNILSAQRAAWLAIDPKGLIGEPEYETATWILNPYPTLIHWMDLNKIILRRLDQFTNELGFDRQRMIGWTFVHALLSAWWSLDDNDQDWKYWLALAELIQGLKT